MYIHRITLTAGCALASMVALIAKTADFPRPPDAPKIPIIETIHGVTITDNYRWLENQNSPQTRAWIAAEQKYTQEFFASVGNRDEIRKSLAPFERMEDISVPIPRNGRYFFTRLLPSEEQHSILVRYGASGNDEVLVDPNTLAPDHSVSVLIADVTNDGKILAYQIRKGGQDETEVRFLDVNRKKVLPDVLPRARNTVWLGHAFVPNGSAIYYTRTGPSGPRVFMHRLGSPVSTDQQVFGTTYGPGYFATCGVTSTSTYLFCTVEKGAAGVEGDIYERNLKADKALHPIVKHLEGMLGISPYRDHLLLLTSWQAANRRIMDIELQHPAQNAWKEIVHEGKTPITSFSIAANKLYVTRLEDVAEHCYAFRANGDSLGEIKLPTVGSVDRIEGEEEGAEAFLGFSSFTYPPSVIRLSNGDETSVWWRASVPVPLDQLELKQVWYASKDGTKIPMFVVSKKGAGAGNRPTLLTGYGGFNLVQPPRWSRIAAWWVERGGVFAIPALRGGGEFGEAWHRAGMFEKKQNVFDDFIAAAEYLIHSGTTSPDRLAIYGTSNGGLLVGAAMTQRPDLFRAVVCGAPLLDMIRYQNFRIARAWVSEYGSSEDAKQFRYLLKYSPYQHVKAGVRYPAVMFWTGDSDTRVDPLHARKMCAEMQADAQPGRPIIIRYDTLTGHSGGRSVDQQLDFDTDFLGFVQSQVG